MARYRVSVRTGGRVRSERFDDLDAALALLERRARELAGGAHAGTVDLKLRRFAPVQQVTARIELSGPHGLRGGVDVRGDGSVEAYTGRLRRRLLEQGPGESPYEALARGVAG